MEPQGPLFLYFNSTWGTIKKLNKKVFVMSVMLTIKVVPQSGRQEFAVDKSGQLKCYLKSAPEKGRANAELIKYIAVLLKIPQDSVLLVAGHTARTKKIMIQGSFANDDVLKRLGIDHQMGIK